MARIARFAVVLVICAVSMRGVAASLDSEAKLSAPDGAASVEKLIRQLGSDQYFLRHQAEEELIQRGADAFDLLQRAQSDLDLEIAESAHYILQQIRIEWSLANDPAAVQAIMHRYGDLSQDERKEKMDELAALEGDEGLRALCRIARFEPSSRLARYAALKIMQAKALAERASKGPGIITAEVGDSERSPSEWLRTYAKQLSQPDHVLPQWLQLIDEEAALTGDDSADTEASYVFELIDIQLELCKDKHEPEAVFAGLQRRTDLYVQNSGRLRDGLLYAMNWIWENEQWDALKLLEDHYADTIREQRLLIYFSALSRWKQGKQEQAEEFAEKAFSLEADDADERSGVGDLIGEMGRHDWAEREWWRVVDTFPVLDMNSLGARRSLSSLRLHDRGEDKQAAKLMQDVVDAVEADAKIKGNILREPGRRKWFNQFHAQKEYFLACQAATEGNYAEQREHLDAAYSFDSEDADVLIAIYRSPGADEAYHQAAIDRVRLAANNVAAHIDQEPDNPQWYNHWAWLVSNTEGDFAQAVKYSQRSLELSPDSPSYLDTLGRCYYSVGDLDNAVKVEREAIRRHPHLQVMRDQLRMFETALAEREQK